MRFGIHTPLFEPTIWVGRHSDYSAVFLDKHDGTVMALNAVTRYVHQHHGGRLTHTHPDGQTALITTHRHPPTTHDQTDPDRTAALAASRSAERLLNQVARLAGNPTVLTAKGEAAVTSAELIAILEGTTA